MDWWSEIKGFLLGQDKTTTQTATTTQTTGSNAIVIIIAIAAIALLGWGIVSATNASKKA